MGCTHALWLCTHTHTRTHERTCLHTCIHTHMNTHTHTHVLAHMHTHAHEHTPHTDTHTHVHTHDRPRPCARNPSSSSSTATHSSRPNSNRGTSRERLLLGRWSPLCEVRVCLCVRVFVHHLGVLCPKTGLPKSMHFKWACVHVYVPASYHCMTCSSTQQSPFPTKAL